mgnify:CR=1 FL=1
MSSFDLILKNGTVFTPESTEITDIAVKDGKIVDLAFGFVGQEIGEAKVWIGAVDVVDF